MLEWLSDQPQNLTPDRAVLVHVTILEEVPQLVMTERGLRMAAALEKLAQLRSSIASLDPVAWEREMRQERMLVGRDSDAD
jgi:hypothetical protein